MTCGLCETHDPPRFTEMYVPRPGAAPICPVCDRLHCSRCQTMFLAGTEDRCPNCRLHWKHWFGT